MSEQPGGQNKNKGPRTHKVSIEVSGSQFEFLRLFAQQNDIPPSHVYRSLLYIMQTDMTIARRVIKEIYKEYEAYNSRMRLESINKNLDK